MAGENSCADITLALTQRHAAIQYEKILSLGEDSGLILAQLMANETYV